VRYEVQDEAQDEGSKPWSRAEAEAWREKNPPSSPWRVVAAQAVVGLVCAALVWVITRRGDAVWSALYGAAAVVLPSALLARGMTRGTRNPVAVAAGFMFWEMLKIGVAIAMLAIAVRVVPNLSWPALLVTMVVCIKVNWVALLWRGRRSDNKA
jgi:ATP synthase protein I